MDARNLGSRILIVVGGIAMPVGALDPLEGSLVILTGTGLVALGTFLGGHGGRRLRIYWLWVFILVAVGVLGMIVLSARGGIGGTSGNSMWWGVLIVPYPVGWIMGIGSLMRRLVTSFRQRARTSNPERREG